MQTLIDLYELRSGSLTDSGVRDAPRGRSTIDLEIDWEEETSPGVDDKRGELRSPGVSSESWRRARCWASEDP